jgi:hypothetical protein
MQVMMERSSFAALVLRQVSSHNSAEHLMLVVLGAVQVLWSVVSTILRP